MKTTFMQWLLVLSLGCTQANQPNNNEINASAEGKQAAREELATIDSVVNQNQGKDIRIDFENAAAGALPTGWTAAKTGQGNTIKWAVVQEGNNKALAQLTSNNPSNHFNVVTLDSITATNVNLKTRFKSIRGKIDQGGGFVWRFQDPDNYYIVRANSLEDNVVLYKVVNGKRTDLPLVGKGRTYGADAKVPTNQWNRLELTAQDSLFTVSVNGTELFRVIDKTFPNAGKVGFWSKADAVSYFDDFDIQVKK